MKLPEDNSLELPDENELCLDRNDQLLSTLDDALALLPVWARQQVSPVRDALLAAWQAMANHAQAKYGLRLAAVTTPRNAAGPWLADWGKIHHKPKAAGENEGQYRDRLLEPGDVVSPNAIKAAVDPIVAKVSPIAPVYLEPAVDAAFAAPLDSPWNAFAQPSGRSLWADYPDNVSPTVGAYAVPNVQHALFWIVLPGDASAGEPQPYSQPNDGGDPGTQWIGLVYEPSFAFNDPTLAQLAANQTGFVFESDTPLLEQVRSTVEPIRGGGVTWMAFGDPGISGAK